MKFSDDLLEKFAQAAIDYHDKIKEILKDIDDEVLAKYAEEASQDTDIYNYESVAAKIAYTEVYFRYHCKKAEEIHKAGGTGFIVLVALGI